jgi:hypothetical protein
MALRKRAFVVARAGDTAELGKARGISLNDDRSRPWRLGGARHYSRWPEPWRPEDDWGPILAAVMFIILCGLIVYGSGVQLERAAS